MRSQVSTGKETVGKIVGGAGKRKDWYQRLEYNFFELCKKRGIKGEARTLLIYLRTLSCAFQNPCFYFFDRAITDALEIAPSTLWRSRLILRKSGVIDFKSYHIRGKAVDYVMLKTELAPQFKPSILKSKPSILKGLKNRIREEQPFKMKSEDYIRVNKKERVSQPMTEEQREEMHKSFKELKDKL